MTKAKGPLFTVKFRRRRNGVTDYATRLALLKGGKPRAVIRKTNRFLHVQVVDYAPAGDRTVCSASSRELSKYGFDGKCNAPSAYLTGLLAAKKASAKGVNAMVADIGRQTTTKGGILFAVVKGIADGGVSIPLGESILGDAKRIEGEHLKAKEKFAAAKAKIISG